MLVYFGTVLAGYLLNPLTTAVAYPYQSDEAITVSGYLVRREEVLPSYDGLLFISREEGERVSAGGSVGVVYHSQEALEQARQLQQLRLQLEQLEYAQSVASGSQEALQLDSSIAQELVALKSAMASRAVFRRGGRGGGAGDLCAETGVHLQRGGGRGGAAGRTGRPDPRPVRLHPPEQHRRHRAGGGVLLRLVDGYESVLTPDMLEELTPGQLRSVSPTPPAPPTPGRSSMGTSGTMWRCLSEADAGQLWEGAEVSLRFVSGLEKGRAHDGGADQHRRKRAAAGGALRGPVPLRHHPPKGPERPDHPAVLQRHSRPQDGGAGAGRHPENEAGEEEAVSLTGVYCRVGAAARFKPVDILYQGEDYYLVSPAPDRMGSLSETGRELRTLRNGDEVVVTAKDLYDGKVIG